MTERINQLAEQNANEIADLFTLGFFDNRMVNDVAEINKKFSKLIIKETMQVVANQLPSNQYLNVAEAVIAHFRVKK